MWVTLAVVVGVIAVFVFMFNAFRKQPDPISDGTWVVAVRRQTLPIYESGQLPDDLTMAEGMLLRRGGKMYVRVRDGSGHCDVECMEGGVAPRSDHAVAPEDMAWLSKQREAISIYLVVGKRDSNDYQGCLRMGLGPDTLLIPGTRVVYGHDQRVVEEKAKAQLPDSSLRRFIVVVRELPAPDIYVT